MLIGLGLFLSGIFFTLIAIILLFKRRILLSGLNGAAGFSLLSMATAVFLILLNVHTYIQLTSEIELAEIMIGVKTEQGTQILLRSNDNQQEFFINAAEWQLDARFLKWKSWAYLVGSEPLVRIETLSGRRPYLANVVANSYELNQENQFLSELGSTLSGWIGMVDTYYGSSVYMPAVEGSVFSVSATISGLVARAENSTAKQAVSRWMSQ